MARTSGGLSHSASRKVLHSVFSSYDFDKSGELDKDELASMLNDLGIDDTDQFDGLVMLADQDGDGQVTFEEFEKWIKQHSVMEMMRSTQQMEILERITSLFQEYDEDGDMQVDWLEWQRAFVSRGSTVTEAVRVWNLCNTNGDSVITFSEFWTYLKNLMPPVPAETTTMSTSHSASSVGSAASVSSTSRSSTFLECPSPTPSTTTLCSSAGATPTDC